MSRLSELATALGEPSAPTALHDGRAHIEDALTGLEAVGTPATLADLGSGNGIPGLVLADALPGCAVTCVEAARKKAAWIERTAVRMGLENVSVAWSRAEEWDSRVEVVVARALASLAVLCEYAAPLLTDGGQAVFYKGAVGPGEAADGRHAASVLGLSEPSVVPVAGSERRALWIYRKVGTTPAGYPRRPGMALKRPLRSRPGGPVASP